MASKQDYIKRKLNSVFYFYAYAFYFFLKCQDPLIVARSRDIIFLLLSVLNMIREFVVYKETVDVLYPYSFLSLIVLIVVVSSWE